MKYLQTIKNSSEITQKEYSVIYYDETTGKMTIVSNKCTVTFKDHDGSIISSKEYTYGETVVVPTFSGTWVDHTFIGWGDVTIDTAKGNVVYIAQYEVTPKVTIVDMQDTYTDTAAIALNATKTKTVTGEITFTTDLAANVAHIADNALVFDKHYEGSVVITASATDVHGNTQTDTKTITVSCNGAETTACTITEVSTPEVAATATSATVTYKCNVKTTTHDGSSTTVAASKEKVVTFSANESEEARDITSFFTCEHGEIVNYTVKQEGKPASPYQTIDLGLPSGLKWANMNVGASKPEDYGLYFQWGDTVGYTGITDDKQFTWSECPYQTVDTTDNTQTKFTKYLGSVDSPYKDPEATDENAVKTVLDLVDDAARANMGGDWRMPKSTEFQELYDNTTSEWTIENGVYGRKFTSKKEGNTNYIFIPAAGYCNNGSVYLVGTYGYVWSSSLYTSDPYGAYDLHFGSSNVNPQRISGRYVGRSVRGVRV